jgi:hypothetical protein
VSVCSSLADWTKGSHSQAHHDFFFFFAGGFEGSRPTDQQTSNSLWLPWRELWSKRFLTIQASISPRCCRLIATCVFSFYSSRLYMRLHLALNNYDLITAKIPEPASRSPVFGSLAPSLYQAPGSTPRVGTKNTVCPAHD